MPRPTPISGFPEWLPHQRLIEQQLLDTVRRTFELHGFVPIETRAVEPLDQLLRKGDTSKEVYVLRRLQADDDDATDSGLGLHFDLTVPFARYVLENAGKLTFPLRRYQIQKAWRGERPQEGRYREFTQADIDVVANGTLPGHYEAELPVVVAEALSALPMPPIRVHTNDRRLAEGFYLGLGIDDPDAVLRAVDKLDKIGAGGVAAALAEVGLTDEQAAACLSLAEISSTDGSFADRVRALGVQHPLLDEGIAALTAVVETAAAVAPGLVVADLRIARGLDYYTGLVYEVFVDGYESFGAVCSGGRYDALASDGNQTYPGVGMSIGITRILGLLFGRDLIGISRQVPTCVLVALPAETDRPAANKLAQSLRSRGIATEVSSDAAKYGKQIRYAERRGIPFVWFPGGAAGDAAGDGVRDIRSGEQVDADAGTWTPPAADLHPTVSAGTTAGRQS